jgi:WD repeat-containing protein 1 (actin-interacting protein 1)
VAGTADGRVVSFEASSGEATYVTGSGHSSLITGLAPSFSGKVFSVGFDDHVREIDGKSYTFGFHRCTKFLLADLSV